MSQATATKSPMTAKQRSLADSFSKSVVLISGLMLVQRGIGFVRSFYVCGTLAPAEVGRWDLAFNFLMLIAPLAVFGIPGAFGRYLPRYEDNGNQRRFLQQTTLACLVLAMLASLAIWVFRDAVAIHFFGDRSETKLVELLAVGLPVVVFFNFATSWFTGKRLNRFVFRIQFSQTLFFALLCVVAFQLWSITAHSVVTAYLLSCLIGIALAASYVFVSGRETRGIHSASEQDVAGDDPIWRKILPLAIWVWLSNALINLFSLCDRLLLVNFHPSSSVDVQSLIGQYHTACIFPVLLMTVGAMAGSTGLPYLSKDWESGNREAVTERMNLMLKAMGLLCVVASAGILLIAPILFGELWKDKFAMGESLLPMTLCYCSLAAMTMVAEIYFLCIEKSWISSCFLLVGLTANFAVGLALVGQYGIEGVVASTLVAHATVLFGVLVACRKCQMRVQPGVFVIAAALMTLCFGKLFSLVTFLVLVLLAFRTDLLFQASERRAALERLQSIRGSLGR